MEVGGITQDGKKTAARELAAVICGRRVGFRAVSTVRELGRLE